MLAGRLDVYHDRPTALYKMGTPYYNPALGRFMQVEPVESGSVNRYDYANQAPINTVDVTAHARTAWPAR